MIVDISMGIDRTITGNSRGVKTGFLNSKLRLVVRGLMEDIGISIDHDC